MKREMGACIVELRGRYAAALTSDGQFVRIRNQGYSVGQTVRLTKRQTMPAQRRQLRALTAGPLAAPERYFALIAKGDELLDWREMAARYARTHLHLLEGGDHALSDFDAHMGAVLAFLDLA